ncbi:protein kinase [Lujinxingia vulgaris]|uniref:histidine kinase n=1 Tax=Lujinxingia vulgaris TaxID=2600176 RepID=A0A5C6X1Z6_9DELT|nr:BREX system ATP-binding domain-containing protein [Lujinxingia vulgaris]TXD35172.1 protein kinase [Lujinxingia vulgaris]
MTKSSTSVSGSFPGVRVRKEIGRGAESIVYLASRGVETVAVKTSREPGQLLDEERRRRFLREGCLLGALTHRALPRIFEVGQVEKTPYIILEHVNGETLARVVADSVLEEEVIWRVAREVADALAQVHENGLLHRDIHPANILLDATGRARLIDFGLAAEASADDAQRLEGTLRFMAPEQGGMLNRLVDARSDLYALGAVLHFCATGRPPYEGRDRREVLRQHATAPIPDVRETRAELSETLSALIRRLLAKDPDDRFGSARALVEHIDRHRGEQSTRTIEAATPRAGHRRLIGRRAELQQLLEVWDRARGGHTALAMIDGPSGSGKTRLMRELEMRARAEGALALSTSAQLQEPHPFAALQRLVEPLYARLSADISDTDGLRETLQRRLSGKVDALHRALPGLANLLHEDVDARQHSELRANVEPTPSTESDRSDVVYDAVAATLAEFARILGALLVSVDNAHLVDDATMRVLERLEHSSHDAPLMLLLGFDRRGDTALRAGHIASAMRRTLAARVTLNRLEPREVDAFVRARLGDSEVDPRLIERVIELSHGNAYAIESFLRAMLDAAILRPSWGRWSLDLEAAETLTLPSDLSDLMHFQLDHVSAQTRDLLAWIALFGGLVDPGDVAACADIDHQALDEALTQATYAGLLRETGESGLALVHESLRESLLERLSPEERALRHQRVATILDRNTGSRARDFDLARHYALGQAHTDPHRAVEVNHQAGRLAQHGFDYAGALAFLTQAARIAEQRGLPIAVELDRDLGHIAARTGQLELSRHHLGRAITHSNDPVERAHLRGALSAVSVTNLELRRATEELRGAFAEIDEHFPTLHPADLASSLRRFARSELIGTLSLARRIFDSPLTPAEERRLRVLKDLYDYLSRVAYFTFEDELMLQSALRQHDIATRLGDARYLARTLAMLAFIAAILGQKKLSDLYLARAEVACEQAGDRSVRAMVGWFTAFCLDMLNEPLAACAKLRETLLEQGQWLEGWELSNGTLTLAENYILRGHHRRATTVLSDVMRELKSRLGDEVAERQFVLTPLQSLAMSAELAIGQTENLERYAANAERYFIENQQKLYYHAEIHQRLLLYCLESGQLDEEADRHIRGFESLPMPTPNVSYYLRYFYVCKAWIMIERAERTRRRGAPVDLGQARAALAELEPGATTSMFKAYVALFKARIADLSGELKDVEALHNQALAHADRADMPLVHFEVARHKAALARTRHQRRLSDAPETLDVLLRYVHQALHLAQSQGWSGRARAIRADFADELRLADRHGSELHTASSLTSSDTMTSRMQQQFDALLRIHQILSEVGNPDTKLHQVLDELIAIFGAERGYFFQIDQESPQLQAARSARPSGSSPKAAASADLPDPLKNWARGIIDQVCATQRPLLVSTTREGARWDQPAFLDHLRSAIAVPMHTRGELRGVVYLDSTLSEGVFSRADIRTLQSLTNSLSMLLEAARTSSLEVEVARASEKSASLLEHATSAVQLGLAIISADASLISASPTLYAMAEPWGSIARFWREAWAACDWQSAPDHRVAGRTLKTALADLRTPEGHRQIFEITNTGEAPELSEHTDHQVLLIRDVTASVIAGEELKLLNVELKLASEEAMSANRAKSVFLASMSHELRTPLNAIIGYSEMILEERSAEEEPELVEDITRIQLAGKHLLRLVSDILDISKIEAGHVTLAPGEFKLPALVGELERAVAPLLNDNANTLHIGPIPELTLFNDELRLHQLLLNLLSNAAKFTEGGDVFFDVAVDEKAGRLEFAIRDTGIGMDEAALARVFEAFYQAGQHSISRHGGTGLGLTIVRRFCDLMGGTIDVHSSPGEGTTFMVSLPQRIAQAETA